MYRFSATIVLLLACLLLAGTAHAYINTPFITPALPYAGDALYVNVDSGVCDAIAAEPGYPQITTNGSSVRVVLLALRYTNIELCNLPSGVATVPVGVLSAGSYQITVDVFYYDGFGNPHNDTIGVLPLVVQAAAAAPIGAPATTPAGLVLLVAMLGSIAVWRQRRSGLAVLALMPMIGQARAEAQVPVLNDNRTIEVLLSPAPGAPSAEQVVAYIQSPGGVPPLVALRTLGPQRASFLLTQRAEGALLAAIRENPGSPRAKLERYIVVAVSSAVDVEQLLARLTVEPYVETAYLSRQFDPSSVTLGAFSVTTYDSGVQT